MSQFARSGVVPGSTVKVGIETSECLVGINDHGQMVCLRDEDNWHDPWNAPLRHLEGLRATDFICLKRNPPRPDNQR